MSKSPKQNYPGLPLGRLPDDFLFRNVGNKSVLPQSTLDEFHFPFRFKHNNCYFFLRIPATWCRFFLFGPCRFAFPSSLPTSPSHTPLRSTSAYQYTSDTMKLFLVLVFQFLFVSNDIFILNTRFAIVILLFILQLL